MTADDPNPESSQATGEPALPGPEAIREAESASEAEVHPVASETIVVGFDGSVSSREALGKALELATALDRPVTVVRTWTIDRLPPGTLWKDGYVSSYDEISEVVKDHAVEDSADVVSEYPGARVEYRGILGHAAEVLRRVSKDAFMLVLGSRGRGGFTGMLLGSVSESCVRHAHCPVLVVRH